MDDLPSKIELMSLIKIPLLTTEEKYVEAEMILSHRK